MAIDLPKGPEPSEGLTLEEMIILAKQVPLESWTQYAPGENVWEPGRGYKYLFAYDYQGSLDKYDIFVSAHSSHFRDRAAIKVIEGVTSLGFSGQVIKSHHPELATLCSYIYSCVKQNEREKLNKKERETLEQLKERDEKIADLKQKIKELR